MMKLKSLSGESGTRAQPESSITIYIRGREPISTTGRINCGIS